MAQPLKFCKDCRWYIPATKAADSYPRCELKYQPGEQYLNYLVEDGVKEPPHALGTYMRGEGPCGEDAKLFLPQQ